MRKNLIASGAVAGALLLGGSGAALILPNLVAAADPSASPITMSPDSGAPSTSDGRWMGGRAEAVTDASVVAKAIGISETDLNTTLTGGQTIAAVAKAHGVDVQKVIDALIADKKDEVAAALKAGTITQAQADQQLAGATQFATDQANGTGFGPGGFGSADHGRDGPGGFGGGAEAPSTSPSAGTGTSG